MRLVLANLGWIARKTLVRSLFHGKKGGQRPRGRRRDDGRSGPWGFDRKTLTPTLSHGEREKKAAPRPEA